MVKALISYLCLEKQSWKNLILSLLTTTVNVCKRRSILFKLSHLTRDSRCCCTHIYNQLELISTAGTYFRSRALKAYIIQYIDLTWRSFKCYLFEGLIHQDEPPTLSKTGRPAIFNSMYRFSRV